MQNEFKRAKLLVERINKISFVLSEHSKLNKNNPEELCKLKEIIEYMQESVTELSGIFEKSPESTELLSDFNTAIS